MSPSNKKSKIQSINRAVFTQQPREEIVKTGLDGLLDYYSNLDEKIQGAIAEKQKERIPISIEQQIDRKIEEMAERERKGLQTDEDLEGYEFKTVEKTGLEWRWGFNLADRTNQVGMKELKCKNDRTKKEVYDAYMNQRKMENYLRSLVPLNIIGNQWVERQTAKVDRNNLQQLRQLQI